jgi:hypothetical protein
VLLVSSADHEGDMTKINKVGLPDKWLVIPVIILGILLLWKIIERGNLLYVFQMDFTNDISSYMARLYLLAKYGFHQTIPEWYNGNGVLFRFSPPVWYYFTLPIYWITKNVQSATYISILIMYALALVFTFFLFKKEKISPIKRIALFLFFFASPIAIGNFIRLGKVVELLGWVIFIPAFILLLHYKNKRLDKNFLWVIIPYSLLMLTYPPLFITFSLLTLGLFLIKKQKERMLIIGVLILVALITSFWWYPYITLSGNFMGGNREHLKDLISSPLRLWADNLTITLVPIIFLVVAYFYIKSAKEKNKEMIFLYPTAIFSLLLLTRVLAFIPILTDVHADSYNFFLLFVTIFLLFKTKVEVYPKNIKKLIPIMITGMVVIGVIIVFMLIPPYKQHSAQDKEVINIMAEISKENTKSNVIILSTKTHPAMYYAYGLIYYDMHTPAGNLAEEMPIPYQNKMEEMLQYYNREDCNNFLEYLSYFKVDDVIAEKDKCGFLKSCRLQEKKTTENVCLYSTPSKQTI